MGSHPEDKSIEEILEEVENNDNFMTGSVYDDSDLSWEDRLVNKPPSLLLAQPQGFPSGSALIRNWEKVGIGLPKSPVNGETDDFNE
ncbi:unnamed protein product, partial [Mesorhabditis belari]|uniref:Uncharacterized protein n=1 Tax=Mesorhabditis belari TaxID=2138241 RepID=A0AAF3FN63_9BILA